MKAKHLTIVLATILTTVLLGAYALNVFSAPPVLKLKVKWKPATYTLDNGPPDPWNAQVYFTPPRSFDDVVLDSFVLEGKYNCEAPAYPHSIKDRLVVPFHGDDVVDAILAKLPHMAPGIYILYLEVSGRLTDGTTFSGKGEVTFTYPEFPLP